MSLTLCLGCPSLSVWGVPTTTTTTTIITTTTKTDARQVDLLMDLEKVTQDLEKVKQDLEKELKSEVD